ncbi:MAG TPA: hypothetical protein VM240_03125 [Verrucomicrobiae bacterium]|nr:hypothetical protein [Verrucomicrobiae bacterium]
MNAKLMFFFAAGVALLAGLFVLFKPAPAPVEPASAPAVAATMAPVAPVPKTFEIAIEGGKRVAGPDVIALTQGDEVLLRMTADKADELHLHGYDLSLKLQPGTPAELRFRAERSGRFEYELHHAHADLGVIEVQPR